MALQGQIKRARRRAARWLCPAELDRKRAIDTSERVRHARVVFAVLLGVCIFGLAPFLNWWIAPIYAAQAAYLATLDRRMAKAEYPELKAAGGMLTTGISMLACIAITGGGTSPLLPLLVVPVSFIAARFRSEVVLAGVILACGAAIMVGLVVDPQAIVDDPAPILVAICLIGGVGALSVAIQGAEVQHRRESVLDPLTGLLNRKALESRFEEIEQQAQLSGGRVCLIELDLDHFKRVNDSLGHTEGDAVLRDAAYEMRKALRTFELVYRIGGEEFLVIVPGADLDTGLELAERLRQAVAGARPGGVKITISAGVAAAQGDDVVFQKLFGEADAALYTAKRKGRDQVATVDGPRTESSTHPEPLRA